MKRVVTRIRAGGTEIDEWTLRNIYTSTVAGNVSEALRDYVHFPNREVGLMNIMDIEYKEVDYAPV